MKLDVQVTADGPPLTLDVWTQQDSERVAEWLVATINLRVRRSMGADGEPFRRYSTRRMYVRLGSETARRLAPKGGVPVKGKDGTVISVRYDGGYAQYKRESRRGNIATGEVDLTLSGQMLREIRPTVVTETLVEVDHTGGSAVYGPGVDAKRPHMALAKDEVPKLDRLIESIVDAHLQAGRQSVPTEPIA